MSSLILKGNTSGQVTIAAPDVGNNNTLTLPSTSSTLATQNALGVRNLIINGDMRIDQRNSGSEINPVANNTYSVDRWNLRSGTTSLFKFQQNAGSVTPPEDFTNYLGITSLSSHTVGATEISDIRQGIEGQNIAHLKWGTADAKTVTVSFWVRSSLTGTFGASLSNTSANRCYPFSYSITSANTWEKKTITIDGDTTGTWSTDNTIGIRITFSLGTGTTYSGTSGAWTSSLHLSVTGETPIVGTSGATFYITGVQLEADTDTATPFEHRPYDMELARCKRYYRRYSSVGNTNASTPMIGTGLAKTGGTAIYRMGWCLDIAMRTSPSINFSGMSCWAGSNVPSVSNSTNYSGTDYVDLDCTTSGLSIDSAGCVAKLYFPNTSGYVEVNAEL